MNWSNEAEAALKAVPSFVRNMAKKAVEEEAHKQGQIAITPELVKEAKEKYITSIFGGKSENKEDKPQDSLAREDKGQKEGRKVAIIRCDIVAETCPGIVCMKSWNNKKIHFEGYGPDDQLIAMLTCGGCSGRRVSRMVSKLKKYGLDVVHLSSCMVMDNDDYPTCPHLDEIRKTIRAKGIDIVEGTHH